MKKKGLKAVAMVGALALTMVAAVPKTASAEHLLPGTEDWYCSNSYYSVTHVGFYGAVQIPSHRRTDGRECNRTRLIYIHQKTCTSCGAILDNHDVWECAEEHSVCPDPVPNCMY